MTRAMSPARVGRLWKAVFVVVCAGILLVSTSFFVCAQEMGHKSNNPTLSMYMV